MNLGPPTLNPQADGASLDGQWRALHAAADAVKALAGNAASTAAPPATAAQLRGFPVAAAALTAGRRRLVEEGLADLVAIMEPGLAALLSVHEGGGNAAIPAQALWQEFVSARAMLLWLAFDQVG